MKLISRDEAKAAGLKRYFTGGPCKHGHVAERYVSSRACAECTHARQKANPEKHRANVRVWAKANPEKQRACERAWKKANPEKHRAHVRAWQKANQEKQRTSASAWRKNNLPKLAAKSRARDARKLKAMPIWACKQSIENIYAGAQRLTVETGIIHHVDHIVPLKHQLVCGLHVEHNLRVIPAVENMSKGNQFDI
ncbi:MAG: hypothetical protein NUV74_05395 [Candidatus Brocadiaceae bacterium]|nr:hypothetical protein [Candidatus Brocadiaceae bacterium]